MALGGLHITTVPHFGAPCFRQGQVHSCELVTCLFFVICVLLKDIFQFNFKCLDCTMMLSGVEWEVSIREFQMLTKAPL